MDRMCEVVAVRIHIAPFSIVLLSWQFVKENFDILYSSKKSTFSRAATKLYY